MNEQNISILITGADGFVGQHVAACLLAQGFANVTALARDDLNLADMDGVAARVLVTQPDIIIDCAGITPHQNAQPDDYNLNIQFTNNIINAIHESGRDIGLIYMSSVSVYGAPTRASGVVFEDDELNPQNPYAQSKVVCERLIQNQGAIQSIIMRIANIAGKDAFINHVLRNGTANLRGDIPFERDIVHMDDICTMVEQSVRFMIDTQSSHIINCGTGHGFGFDAIIAEIERQTGMSIAVTNEPLMPNDIIRLICDRQRAADILNWHPTHTKLDEIIATAIKHHE